MKNSENIDIDVGETVSASFYVPASADKKQKRKLRYLQTMNASNTVRLRLHQSGCPDSTCLDVPGLTRH